MFKNKDSNNRSIDTPPATISKTRPKVTKSISDEDTIKLIALVKEHPCIWKVDHINYTDKIARADIWRNILKEFNTASYTENDLRAKWTNLRIQFRINSNRLNSNQETTEPKVIWKFYNAMKFIDNYLADNNVNDDDKNGNDNGGTFVPRVCRAKSNLKRIKNLKPRKFYNSINYNNKPLGHQYRQQDDLEAVAAAQQTDTTNSYDFLNDYDDMDFERVSTTSSSSAKFTTKIKHTTTADDMLQEATFQSQATASSCHCRRHKHDDDTTDINLAFSNYIYAELKHLSSNHAKMLRSEIFNLVNSFEPNNAATKDNNSFSINAAIVKQEIDILDNNAFNESIQICSSLENDNR